MNQYGDPEKLKASLDTPESSSDTNNGNITGVMIISPNVIGTAGEEKDTFRITVHVR